MLRALLRYGCFLLAIALAVPDQACAASAPAAQAAQKSKRGGAKLKKPAPARPKAARKKTRARRAARVRAHSTLLLDTCLTELFTPDQNALRMQIEPWLDVRYRKGGVTMKGVDCSGFLVRVYGDALGMELPRTSREQAKAGERISEDDMAFGDLVFFRTRLKSRLISHVGIYLGDGRFVHASRHSGVTVDGLASAYYARRFVMARRVLGGGAEALNE